MVVCWIARTASRVLVSSSFICKNTWWFNNHFLVVLWWDFYGYYGIVTDNQIESDVYMSPPYTGTGGLKNQWLWIFYFRSLYEDTHLMTWFLRYWTWYDRHLPWYWFLWCNQLFLPMIRRYEILSITAIILVRRDR